MNTEISPSRWHPRYRIPRAKSDNFIPMCEHKMHFPCFFVIMLVTHLVWYRLGNIGHQTINSSNVDPYIWRAKSPTCRNALIVIAIILSETLSRIIISIDIWQNWLKLILRGVVHNKSSLAQLMAIRQSFNETLCKTEITQLLTRWSYRNLTLCHRYIFVRVSI